jgi:hypothetical protein
LQHFWQRLQLLLLLLLLEQIWFLRGTRMDSCFGECDRIRRMKNEICEKKSAF